MEHSETPWEANRFLKGDGTEIETVEDVAVILSNSALAGDRAELFGVTNGDTDESGLSTIICYTGNGPRSQANAARIVTSVNSHAALVEAVKDLRSIWYISVDAVCQKNRPDIKKCMCQACIEERADAALSKAEGVQP